MNLKIKQFRQSVIDALNAGEFPSELKRLVLYEIYMELRDIAQQKIYEEEHSETYTTQIPKTEQAKQEV